jgi:hypothetical protein
MGHTRGSRCRGQREVDDEDLRYDGLHVRQEVRAHLWRARHEYRGLRSDTRRSMLKRRRERTQFLPLRSLDVRAGGCSI